MSHMADPAHQTLKTADAKALARDIVMNGDVEWSPHAVKELQKDKLETTDCLNVIRGGAFDPPEFTNGEWRYAAGTPRIVLIIVFESETKLRVITGWRVK